MNIVETIKNYFAPGYDKRLVNPVEDARILSSIGLETLFLTARNGFSYYYYVAKDEKDISVAKYLLSRNGVKVKKHTSVYYYKPRVVLRIKTAKLNKNPTGKQFVASIDTSAPFSDMEELQKRVLIARNQMHGKVK